jgi:ubiquinone/menaquinone biosynthesis C-methylase UbiE
LAEAARGDERYELMTTGGEDMNAGRLPIILMFILLFGQAAFLAAQTDLSENRELRATERQPPDKVMAAIGVKPGMVVGEIGAGYGRYTVYLARQVGASGRILANDIDERALTHLRDRCERLGFKHVETILGTTDDPLFPANSLDLAVMVWVYHMLEKPDELLTNLRPALKPGATLAILDPRDDEIDHEFQIDRSKPGVKVPLIKERIERSAKAAGFELVRVETFLSNDYIFILKVKD